MMKLLVIVLIASLAMSAAVSNRKANHADLMRAYQAKLAKVVNSNSNSTWVAGHNARFDSYTPATVSRLMGAKLNTPPHLRLPQKAVVVGALPDSFDARMAWANCTQIHTIRDQSDCGSCWAFGAVEAASDRICIESKGAYQPMLSAEDLLSCCDSCGDGCDGGYPSAAWSWFQSPGVVTGGNYGHFDWCQSYSLPNCDHHENGTYPRCGASEYPTPTCSNTCDMNSTYTTTYPKDKHMFATAYSIGSDINAIATEIMTNGPVEATFTVYEDFITYRSGVYSHQTGGVLGGHAIKLLGWGVENGVKYWLVANSWNADWGDKGLFKILRGVDECGIEDDITAGTFTKTETVSRPAVVAQRHVHV